MTEGVPGSDVLGLTAAATSEPPRIDPMLRLSNAALGRLSHRLDVPRYDRTRLTPSIVHLGVGGFHRAHQAVYLEGLARQGLTAWGEIGVGLRSGAMRAILAEQDHLFSVVQQGSEGESARVIGVMTDYLFAGVERLRVLRRLTDAGTRVVTMTITGDGYNVDPVHGFLGQVPEVLRDLRHPHLPTTWFGYLTEALSLRRRAGLGGFTVLSCDNLANNGAVTRTALLGYARLRDETLARWIQRNVTFPDSMVDRITPGFSDAVQRRLAYEFGVEDRSVVTTEPFTQWVVEDNFVQGRPPLEDVGVQVVSDVAPYKLIKSRLLNGTHTAMAYLGWLAGHRTTAAVATDPVMRGFLVEMMRTEMAPFLPRLPEMELQGYAAMVLERLGNERIADPLSRLCRRGSTKVPAYLLPPLTEALMGGRPAPLLTLALAAWFRYLRGTDLDGRSVEICDTRIDDLRERALRGGSDPAPLLGVPGVTDSLSGRDDLRASIASALQDLERHGVHESVRRRLPVGVGVGSGQVTASSARGMSDTNTKVAP
jgi:mannitol 2-dehydrogenase